jgi:hypothetical protein
VCEFNTNDRQVGQLDGNCLDVADSYAGVEEQRPLFANDQITNGLFGLVRFVDGENAPGWPVNLEPWVADRNAKRAPRVRCDEDSRKFHSVGSTRQNGSPIKVRLQGRRKNTS